MSTTIHSQFSHNLRAMTQGLAEGRIQALSPGFLTPDMMLQYVQNRLQETDGQMQGLMDKQHGMQQSGEALTELATLLGKYPSGLPKDETNARAILDAYDAAIIKVGGPETDLGRQLTTAKEGLANTLDPAKGAGGDWGADTGEMAGALSNITRLQSSVSQGGEMLMMKLQSLASQRQQVIQFSTNMISGLSESSKAIAANTGK